MRSLASWILLLKSWGCWHRIFWDVGVKIDREMFGIRDKGGSDSDIAISLFFEWGTILNLSALGIFGINFGDGRVIDGKDAISRRAGRHLIGKDVKTDVVD